MHRTHLYLLVVMAMAINARANGLQPPAVEYLSSLPECLALHQQGWGELGINVCAHAAGQPPDSRYAGSVRSPKCAPQTRRNSPNETGVNR